MSTLDVGIKVTADSRSAVSGLRPLDTALKGIQDASTDAEKALQELGESHKVNVDDDAIQRARDEIDRLRREMRENLRADVNADTTQAQRRIRQLRSTIRELDREDVEVDVSVDPGDVSRIRHTLDGISGGVAKIGSKAPGVLSAVGKVLSVVTLGGAAVAGAVGAVGIASLKLSDQLAQAKIAFTQFLGSGKAATSFLDDLQKFAAKTPFEFPELIESSKTLLAFGVDAKDVVGIMTTLGDAAALTGSNVSDLTTIWGQMQAKGKVANEELLQLTSAGIPAYGLLADAMGKSVGEIQDMASKGELLSGDVLPILQRRLDATFGGGMAKQAETLGGKLSTLQDTLAGFGRSIGDALAPGVDIIAKDLQPALDHLTQWARENKGSIAAAVASGFAAFIRFGAGALEVAAPVLDFMGLWLDAIGKVSEGIGHALNAMGSIPGIPDNMGDSILKTADDIEGMADAAHAGADGMRTLADHAKDAADRIEEAGAKARDGFKGDELTAKIDRVKRHLDDLAKRPPSAQVHVDTVRAELKLKRLRRELEEWKRTRSVAEVDSDISRARRKLKTLRDTLAYLKAQKPSPKINADIRTWTQKLKTVRANLKELRQQKTEAQINPKADAGATNAAVAELNAAAKPKGKDREAPIKATVTGDDQARSTLDQLAAHRVAYIDVYVRQHGSTPSGGTAGPGTFAAIVPQAPDSSGTLRAASLAAPATAVALGPGASLGGGPAATTPATAATTVQLAPRQTPVKVYLDGEEIADRLELKANRLAATSIRRRA